MVGCQMLPAERNISAPNGRPDANGLFASGRDRNWRPLVGHLLVTNGHKCQTWPQRSLARRRQWGAKPVASGCKRTRDEPELVRKARPLVPGLVGPKKGQPKASPAGPGIKSSGAQARGAGWLAGRRAPEVAPTVSQGRLPVARPKLVRESSDVCERRRLNYRRPPLSAWRLAGPGGAA